MEFCTGLCLLALVFVNGWTDAPNAIATAVTCRALTPQRAVVLCAIGNLLGLTLGLRLTPKLLESVLDFSVALTPEEAAVATTAAMCAAVLWAIAAWFFGIPTSESHGMLAGAVGSAFFFVGNTALQSDTATLAFAGLFAVLFFGSICGGIAFRFLCWIFRRTPRQDAMVRIRFLQRIFAALSALLHGMQDGQKFLAMALLCGFLSTKAVAVPMVALALTCGTALGGFRIIKRVGGLVPLSPVQGLAAECGAVVTLFFSTLFGVPVSTTHAKTAAVLGAGVAVSRKKIKFRSAIGMVTAWIATFPICALLGYLFTRLLA